MAKKGNPPSLRHPPSPIPTNTQLANIDPPQKKAKSRVIIVRLLSMAMTRYFYTFTRARTTLPMSMIKYDPIITHN
jgi:large subunit ribosomal protein L33